MRYKVIAHRYWNSNGHAVAIVAVAGAVDDWSAYIGGSDLTQREADALQDVAANGAKLSEGDARYFFPNIQREYRD